MRNALFLFGLGILLSPLMTLAATWQEIADTAKPGLLGAAVYNFRTEKLEGVNLSQRFPLMSVFKICLAGTVLAGVDEGRLSLDQTIPIAREQLRDGVGPVDNSRGGAFTIRELLKAAIIYSDNSAADNLLPLVGGPAGVTTWLQLHGLEGIRVDRDERTIARDCYGIAADRAPGLNASALRDQFSVEQRHRAFLAACVDPRDTATPESLIHFLVDLSKGKLLSAASTAQLLQWMKEVETGPHRLKAGLPAKTRLAHKTGTSGTFEGITLATNDVGLATLPDGTTVAIVACLSVSPDNEAKRESILARCAQAASQR